MRVKKKELRRGLAQLPINYPDPDVQPAAVPGGSFDFDAERMQVELLCKRLAHNEVVVREAALDEVPRYLARVTAALAQMEEEFAAEIASVEAYAAAHPNTVMPYKYDNIPLALHEHRQRALVEEQRARRRQANRELKQRREERRLAELNYGRFGAEAAAAGSDDEDGADAAGEGETSARNGATGAVNEHKLKYSEWMQTWCDVELLFLKLARGLHFCLWHSDKPLVQLACAQRIADLINYPATTRSKVLFYGSLFRVLAREWPTIDRYRMDKYLALVRRMLCAWISLVRDVSGKPVGPAAVAGKGEGPHAARTPHPAKSNARKGSVGAAEDKKKGRAPPAKRSREVSADGQGECVPTDRKGRANEDDASPLSAAIRARSISAEYVQQCAGHHAELRQTLQEIFYIMQEQIIPSATSVGLTMHLCDVAFDEMTRVQLSVPLFVTLAAGIPLYAMSQGNYVEKHVLDNFFPPLAGGVFTSRRAKQLLTSLQKDQKRRAGRTAAAAPPLSAEELEQEAARLAAVDTDALLGELARCCQLFSVSRGTVRAVRVMFSEAELVLRQSCNPSSYKALTRTAQRRRIEREIEEVNETCSMVREERAQHRVVKREVKRKAEKSAIHEKVRSRKAELLKAKKAKDASEVDEKALTRAIIKEEKERKAKKPPRDTKRKKNYKLTKKDLYGEVDSDDEKK